MQGACTGTQRPVAVTTSSHNVHVSNSLTVLDARNAKLRWPSSQIRSHADMLSDMMEGGGGPSSGHSRTALLSLSSFCGSPLVRKEPRGRLHRRKEKVCYSEHNPLFLEEHCPGLMRPQSPGIDYLCARTSATEIRSKMKNSSNRIRNVGHTPPAGPLAMNQAECNIPGLLSV